MTETVEDLKPLSKTDLATLAEYFKTWNGTRAWMATHPRSSYNSARASAAEWLAKPNIKAAIAEKLSELHMSADEALALQTEIAHADTGVFYKIVETWMFNPLPSYEILDEKEVIDEEAVPPKKRISYLVRHVVLDMNKVIDPRYSHLIREFSDNGKRGLKIKTYDKQAAIRDVLKVHGKFTEKVDLSNSDGSLQPNEDVIYERLLERIQKRLAGDEPEGASGVSANSE